MKSQFASFGNTAGNPNFVYGSLFGGMCRAFHALADLNAIKNSTSNFKVCIDFVYEDNNPSNNVLDDGEFVTTLIGFQVI